MAAPNLLSLTNVKIDTAIGICTTSLADLIAAITTGHAFTLEAIFCCNYHATTATYVTVMHKKGGTEYAIIPRLRVAAGQTLNGIEGRSLYMAEGDSLRIKAEDATSIVVFAPYTDVN